MLKSSTVNFMYELLNKFITDTNSSINTLEVELNSLKQKHDAIEDLSASYINLPDSIKFFYNKNVMTTSETKTYLDGLRLRIKIVEDNLLRNQLKKQSFEATIKELKELR